MMELVCFFSRRPGINPIPPGFSPIDIDIDFGLDLSLALGARRMNKMEVGTDGQDEGDEALLLANDDSRPKLQSRLSAKCFGTALGGALLLALLVITLGGDPAEEPNPAEGQGGKTAPSEEPPGTGPPPVPCDPSSWQPDATAHNFVADCSQCAPATYATTGGGRAREGGCDVATGPIAKRQKCLIVSRTAGFVGGEVMCDGTGTFRVTPAIRPDAVRTCPPAAPAAATRTPITKVAFGSCAWEHEDSQPVLGTAIAHAPQLFVYLGDNVYGDTVSMDDLQMKCVLHPT
jgi:hypothetical protein